MPKKNRFQVQNFKFKIQNPCFYYQPSTTCPELNRRVNHQLLFRKTNNDQFHLKKKIQIMSPL